MYEKMCRSPDPVAEFSVIPISPTSDARSVFSLVVTSFLNLELGACMLLMYSKKLIQPQYSALHDFGFLSQIPNFSTNYLFFPFHEKKFFFFHLGILWNEILPLFQQMQCRKIANANSNFYQRTFFVLVHFGILRSVFVPYF